jgi:hypothetical protein
MASFSLLVHTVIISDSVKDSIGDVRREAKTTSSFPKIYKMTSIAEDDIGTIQTELFWVSGLLILLSVTPWVKCAK